MKEKSNWSHRVRKEIQEYGSIEYYYVSSIGAGSVSGFPVQDLGEILEIRDDFGTGKVLRTRVDEIYYTVWVPAQPKTVRFDEHERIAPERWKPRSGGWSYYPEIKVEITTNLPKNSSVCFTYLKIEDPDESIYKELQSIGETESKRYLKSEWFDAESPSDFWNYFINGDLYDPRTDPRKADKRFKSQQCAFAWWGYFDMLIV